ncbi:DUF3716 domain-containing protein [Aspergillus mulundensis]|uniref:Uncharacterized protein n=1 Tax=Aspergillus mulundensis TaxID=1810919 RepID=A0A3D8RYV2_9EURO|nr:hypothetical protein DSM5745_06074 [Aspergillus mulundensis]RDW79222.1 hypothetical protein DSM5745_06074 [Aspergillus mulundensis]
MSVSLSPDHLERSEHTVMDGEVPQEINHPNISSALASSTSPINNPGAEFETERPGRGDRPTTSSASASSTSSKAGVDLITTRKKRRNNHDHYYSDDELPAVSRLHNSEPRVQVLVAEPRGDHKKKDSDGQKRSDRNGRKRRHRGGRSRRNRKRSPPVDRYNRPIDRYTPGDRDTEECSNGVSLSVHQQEPGREPGVTADNLPIQPLRYQTRVIGYYSRRPVLRKLDWRNAMITNSMPNGKVGVDHNCSTVNEHKDWRPRPWLGTVLDIEAAFIQTRGMIAKKACVPCSLGRGLWQSCVEEVELDHRGVCANCQQSGELCTNSILYQRTGAQVSPKPSLSNEPATTIREVIGANMTPITTLSAITTTPQPFSEASSHGRHKVLPFPLGREAIHNLPLLRDVADDLRGHLATIMKQIRKLEEVEQEEDPWNNV